MDAISTSEAREHLSEIINLVAYKNERQILNRHGKEVAAIISIDDLRWLEMMEDQEDLADARAELKKVGKEKSESWESVKKELGLS